MTETSPAPVLGWLRVLFPSLAAGVLVGLAGPPLAIPPLIVVALIPFVAVMLQPGIDGKRGAVAGLMLGLGANGVLAMVLQFPPLFAAVLIVGLTLSWTAMGAVAGALLKRLRPTWALLVLPCAITLFEYLSVTLIPAFGTAQSFVRALAPWPGALATAPLAGFTGVVFLAVLFQTAVVLALLHAPRRRLAVASSVAALVVLAVAAGLGWARTSRSPVSTARVAAAGWTYEDEGSPWQRKAPVDEQVEQLLAPLARTAAAAGAQLLVAPEVAFSASPGERAILWEALSTLAAETRMTLVVGYFDSGEDANQAIVFNPDGSIAGEYRKTHLILGMEDYTRGDGSTLVTPTAAGDLGVLICQDDNFTDLGRAYGRAHIQLLAVPTNDWQQVQEFHLQNTILRATDSGFAVVRGASNGVSAIIDANGRLISRLDHHVDGTGVVVADLPIFRGGTPYAHFGNWLPVVCLGLLVFCGIEARRRTDRP